MSGKLVRDKIPEIIKQSGRVPQSHIAEPAEYDILVKQKLEEEVKEFLASENIEELADVLEIIHTIAENKKIDWDKLEQIRINKIQKNGGFSKRIVLDSIT